VGRACGNVWQFPSNATCQLVCRDHHHALIGGRQGINEESDSNYNKNKGGLYLQTSGPGDKSSSWPLSNVAISITGVAENEADSDATRFIGNGTKLFSGRLSVRHSKEGLAIAEAGEAGECEPLLMVMQVLKVDGAF
jgi:hypothetical protein